MKKLITTCLLLTTVGMVSFAQKAATKTKANPNAAAAPAATNNLTPEKQAEQRAKATQAKYGLSAEQYKGIYNAELDYARNEAAVKATGYEVSEGQRNQMNIQRDMYYQNSMTPDQFSKYRSANPAK